jgi:sodium/hydrogen antiporter
VPHNPLRSAGARSTPARLATAGMALTIAAVALIGHLLYGLTLGAVVLLRAVLAPTDSVLASEVQVRDSADRDAVRHAPSGEAALDDGLAFPLVMPDLGPLGAPEQRAAFRAITDTHGGRFAGESAQGRTDR